MALDCSGLIWIRGSSFSDLRNGSEVARFGGLMLMPTHNWLKACLDGTMGLVGMRLAPTIVVLNVYGGKALTESQGRHTFNPFRLCWQQESKQECRTDCCTDVWRRSADLMIEHMLGWNVQVLCRYSDTRCAFLLHIFNIVFSNKGSDTALSCYHFCLTSRKFSCKFS